MSPPRRRRKPRLALFREAGPFRVVSFLGGKLEIQPAYDGLIPKACRPFVKPESETGRNYCPRCGCNHIYGFMGRMALANDLADVLNALTDQAKTSPRSKRRRRS